MNTGRSDYLVFMYNSGVDKVFIYLCWPQTFYTGCLSSEASLPSTLSQNSTGYRLKSPPPKGHRVQGEAKNVLIVGLTNINIF